MSSEDAQTQEFLTAVGRRIRDKRKELKWSVQKLAEESGISRRMLTQIELGQANPSLATIDKVAHALDSSFSELALKTSSIPRPVDGSTVAWEGPDGSRAMILAASSKPGTELWRWNLAPGVRYQAEPDRPGSEEIHHVLSGELILELEQSTLRLTAGMSVTIASDQSYAYLAGTSEPVEFLRVVVGA